MLFKPSYHRLCFHHQPPKLILWHDQPRPLPQSPEPVTILDANSDLPTDKVQTYSHPKSIHVSNAGHLRRHYQSPSLLKPSSFAQQQHAPNTRFHPPHHLLPQQHPTMHTIQNTTIMKYDILSILLTDTNNDPIVTKHLKSRMFFTRNLEGLSEPCGSLFPPY